MTGNKMLCEILLDAKASPHHGDRQGVSPLHYAAANGHNECCYTLVQAGSQLTLRAGEEGWTPAHLAVQAGHLGTVLKLIQLTQNTSTQSELLEVQITDQKLSQTITLTLTLTLIGGAQHGWGVAIVTGNQWAGPRHVSDVAYVRRQSLTRRRWGCR